MPQPENSVTYDRFAYGRNNPIRYSDPSGHDVGCPGMDASRCSAYGVLRPETILKRQYTVPPVVDYIYDEIMTNSASVTVQIIKSLNEQKDPTSKVEALTAWTIKVAPKQDWDHKADIQKMEGDANRDIEYQEAGTREYYFDTWSNIHYGFVGMEAGFDQDTLLEGAGLAQFLDDFLKPRKKPVAEPGVSGWRRYDQLHDRVAIQIGIDLWMDYGLSLQPQDIIWAIEHTEGLVTR